jgi:hypothetical protein
LDRRERHVHFQRRIANGFCFYQKPRPIDTGAQHPYQLDVVGPAQRVRKPARTHAGARRTQAFANLARTEAVRADHRLRTDDEAIRAQSTIWG